MLLLANMAKEYLHLTTLNNEMAQGMGLEPLLTSLTF